MVKFSQATIAMRFLCWILFFATKPHKEHPTQNFAWGKCY